MRTWYFGAALAAMCVAQSAWAQGPPAGNGPLPDPVPEATCPPEGPKFMPGPLTGASAPPGPGDALSLPANVPTAWGQPGTPESGWYLGLGAQPLMRHRPGHSSVATHQGDDAPNTNDIRPDYHGAGMVTFGYLCDDAAIEFSGFYEPPITSSNVVYDPGKIQTNFFNAPSAFLTPAGTSIWNPADTVAISLRQSLASAEMNYRWWSRFSTELEGIVGIRYVNFTERAGVYADAITSDAVNNAVGGIVMNSVPPVTLQALYTARANNHMIMPQTGFEWNMPLRPWLSAGLICKAAFGADDLSVTTKLQRGDGLVAFQERSGDRWTYTSLYEINAFFDFLCLERVRIRAGYTAMWLLHVGEGFQQIDYNLASQPGTVRDTGSVFFHGPMVEMEFFF